jgi:hypothetical protein
LRRLTDCGQVVQVRRFDAAPMAYVTAGGWDFDVVDNLEADICQALRGRSEIGYEDDEDRASAVPKSRPLGSEESGPGRPGW